MTSERSTRLSFEVEVDAPTRDDPTTEEVHGVSLVTVKENGELVFHQDYAFPTHGYAAGAWIGFKAIRIDSPK